MQKSPYLLIFCTLLAHRVKVGETKCALPCLGLRQHEVDADQRELLCKELREAELAVGLVVLLTEDAF